MNMFAKKDIAAQFDAIQRDLKAYRDNRAAIMTDPDLSPAGKDKRIAEAFAQTERKCKMYLASAARMLKEARQQLEKHGVAKRNDEEMLHQLRLANAIKSLELRGGMMNDEELVELAEPFAGDAPALQTLVAAARNGGRDPMRTQSALEPLLGEETARKQAIRELEKFEEFVRGAWARYDADDALALGITLEMKLEHWNETMTEYR